PSVEGGRGSSGRADDPGIARAPASIDTGRAPPRGAFEPSGLRATTGGPAEGERISPAIPADEAPMAADEAGKAGAESETGAGGAAMGATTVAADAGVGASLVALV